MQPSIDFYGLRIDEPITTATDFLVTIVAWFCAWRLGEISSKTVFLTWICAYFWVFGLSTLFGGLFGHAFLRFGEFSTMKLLGWWPGMIATACLARASVEATRPVIGQQFSSNFSMAIWFIFGATSIGIFAIPDFVWVKISGFCQVIGIVLPIMGYVFNKNRHAGSRFFLYAIGITTLASIVFSQKISPHIWFNHADLSHVLLAAAAILYFRGALFFNKFIDNP
jgi:hypothetical protein